MSTTRAQYARKQYLERLLMAIVAYAIVLFVSIRWLRGSPAAPWKYPIALLPVFPALFIPAVVVSFFREMDELQKKIQLEALAFGFTGAAVLTLSYGFLQNAGLPDVSWVWVWPVMGACWGVGLIAANRRYR
jgi:Na+/melibiose symporter-like transporter